MFRIGLFNDLHVGDMNGLTPPHHQTSITQAWLDPFWRFYKHTIGQMGKLDVAIWNGDLVEGPARKDHTHLIIPDLGTQVDAAKFAMEQVKTKEHRIVRGTGYHTDAHLSLETRIGKEMGIKVADEERLLVHGRRLHFRHVVGRSDIPYGQYTQLGKELINNLLEAYFEDGEPADALFRGHVHYCFEIGQWHGGKGFMRKAVSNPAMCLRGPRSTSYVRQLRTWKYDVGVGLIEVDPKSKQVFYQAIGFPIKNYWKRSYECLTG